jgi:protein SCO1/2
MRSRNVIRQQHQNQATSEEFVKLPILASLMLLATLQAWGAQQYPATCMVLKVDRSHNSFVASCQAIPNLMEAMSMPFEVHHVAELDGVVPGTVLDFTLVVDGKTSYAEQVKIRPYVSAEQDPWLARQLKLLKKLNEKDRSAPPPLKIGQPVPNFTLTDQANQQVSFSQFSGKVVALTFIYTSCALPNFCFRTANNFGVLQRRFKQHLGRDLVLLTVTFDPQRDTPDVLARYAKTWHADASTWHFLTGSLPDVRHVTDMFGMDFFPDEGLMNHSLHTAVINRHGMLVANIEGNQFTVNQLGDLVEAVLEQEPRGQAHQAGRSIAPKR